MFKRHEHKRFRGFKLAASLIILVLIILGVFMARGWFRVTAEPKAVSVVYKSSVQNTFNTQRSLVGDPLKELGYKNINQSSNCQMTIAKRLHSEVECISQENAYSKLSDLSASLNSASAKIETALKNNGWQGTYGLGASPYTSLTRLSRSLTANIDWQPDAAYTKNVGSTICLFDSNTAFSKPSPAAISSRLACSRTIDVFGSPWVTNANGDKYLPAN